jgi:NAD(P) transhydrogenase subunit beta
MDLSNHASLSYIAYLVASVLFILSLKGLGNHENARRGNHLGILGMVIALFATVLEMTHGGFELLAATLLLGAVVGGTLAARVEMYKMPQLVAMLHSFVGLAAVLVGIAHHAHGATGTVEQVEVFIGVWIGAITFTGSILAFLKLDGIVSGSPLLLPGRHLINLAMLIASVYLAIVYVASDGADWTALLAMTGLACVLGFHLVAAIGGADMPVVVSMLNSYSGWAAAAAGFLLANDLLIITGALVGSSGAILSYIMCRAMNRSIVAVIFGGFGTGDSMPTPEGAVPEGDGKEMVAGSTEEVLDALQNAKKVVLVPGYGMAVAQAQHPIRELTRRLRAAGTDVRFAIHPVAGRLPGHMDVLLAEAKVPYDLVHESAEINEDLDDVDVVMVVGANDIVNPSALTDKNSPIYGMNVVEVWRAKQVFVLKRGRGTGYAGVQNPVYTNDNTRMYFGDAKESIDALLNAMAA